MLGSDETLTWNQGDDGLKVDLPGEIEKGDYGYVLKIEVEG